MNFCVNSLKFIAIRSFFSLFYSPSGAIRESDTIENANRDSQSGCYADFLKYAQMENLTCPVVT